MPKKPIHRGGKRLGYWILLAICMWAVNIASAQIPTAGLVGYWPFNGNANDMSGNGNHGIPGGANGGPLLTTDRFGNENSCYEFGGYNSRNWIDVPNSSSLQFDTTLSVSFWIQECFRGGTDGWGSYSTTEYNYAVIAKGGDAWSCPPGLWIYTNHSSSNPNGFTGLILSNSIAGANYIFNEFGPRDNCVSINNCDWLHCVIVMEGHHITFYWNSLRVLDTILPNSVNFIATNTQDMHIGIEGGYFWNPRDGKLDDIAMYNRALTEQEVNQLFGNFYDIQMDTTFVTAVSCNTYIFNGVTYNSSGTYVQTLRNSHGCDSIVALQLTVTCDTYETVDTTVCVTSLPYTWHGHLFTQASSYNDTLPNENGSNHIITYHLNVSNPTITIQNITHINCYGASTGNVGVYVSGGVPPYFPVHWENEAGNTVSSNAQLNNQPAGKYRLFVTDNIGCRVLDSINLYHLNDSMIAGVIADNQSVCNGHTPSIFTGMEASGGSNSMYQWQISTDGTSWNAAPGSNNMQNYSYPDSVTSDFSIRRAWISEACGTIYSNTLNVNVIQNNTITIRDTVCQGYPYQSNGFYISSDEISDTLPLTRTLHLQNAQGCDSIINLLLSIRPSVFRNENLTICSTELPYTYNGITFPTETPPFSTYDFNYTTIHGCDSVIRLHLTVGSPYEIDIEDVVCEGNMYNNHGFIVPADQTTGVTELNLTQQMQSQSECDSIVNLHLTVIETSVNIISLTKDFCEEYSAELSVETNMTNYIWSTGETSQTIVVDKPGIYKVTAMQDNCSVSAWYQIDACELNIYLPNTITPDIDDGLNDYFSLHDKYKSMIEDFEIRIYDRWGELIYYSNDKDFQWNGDHHGRIHQNAIYTYLINFTDSRGIPYQLKGNITVL